MSKLLKNSLIRRMDKISDTMFIGGISALAAAIITVTIIVMNQAMGN